jgi:hypothetical protein
VITCTLAVYHGNRTQTQTPEASHQWGPVLRPPQGHVKKETGASENLPVHGGVPDSAAEPAQQHRTEHRTQHETPRLAEEPRGQMLVEAMRRCGR